MPAIVRTLDITRRELLTVMGAAAAIAVRPQLLAATVARAPVPSAGGYGFLTGDELAILDAATAVILPTDDRPGAREIGVVDYIQSLLSFMPGSDANCDRLVTAADVTAVVRSAAGEAAACRHGGDIDGDDRIDATDVTGAAAAVFRARPVFAGGPFSGRNPQPHFPIGATACVVCHGAPTVLVTPSAGSEAVFPPNAFRQFLPLTRLQRLSWKVRLLGPAAVPEVAANPLVTQLLETNLRDKYRNGLAALEASAQPLRFIELTPEQQAEVLNAADSSFMTILRQHVIEATLCVPEYGGNRDRLGWQLVGFDGDSQPLGYEIYDESVPGHYRERPDKPNSGANPDDPCGPFSDGVASLLDLITSVSTVQPAARFASPYCLDIDDDGTGES